MPDRARGPSGSHPGRDWPALCGGVYARAYANHARAYAGHDRAYANHARAPDANARAHAPVPACLHGPRLFGYGWVCIGKCPKRWVFAPAAPPAHTCMHSYTPTSKSGSSFLSSSSFRHNFYSNFQISWRFCGLGRIQKKMD